MNSNGEPVKTNALLTLHEAVVDNIDVRGANCHGCLKTGRWAMITGVVSADPRKDGEPAFYDLFITREQAERAHALLGKLLETTANDPERV